MTDEPYRRLQQMHTAQRGNSLSLILVELATIHGGAAALAPALLFSRVSVLCVISMPIYLHQLPQPTLSNAQ